MNLKQKKKVVKKKEQEVSVSSQDFKTALKVVSKLFPLIVKETLKETKKKAPLKKPQKKKPSPKKKK